MKNIIILVSAFFISFTIIAQNPDKDAQYLKLEKHYTLNSDGSVDFRLVKQIKLSSHYSFHRLYGETFIIYNTEYQQLKINNSYTIMADGKKIEAPNNAFNEVLPRFSNKAPAYNHIREMVVTHTGLEVGATINLDYTINSKSGYYPALMGDEFLHESSPVKELVIKVTVPENTTLNYMLLNIDSKPSVSNNGGQKTYVWTFNSLPASSKDNHLGYHNIYSPRLTFSTKNIQSAYSGFISQGAFNYKTNESMNNIVNQLKSEEIDKLFLMLKIQKLVANELGNLSIPLQYTGFICRTPIETWKSNQGTDLEKALLLTSLLRKANIEAVPVAIVPKQYYNKDIGNLLFANDFMVKVELEKEGTFYITANKTNKQDQLFELGDDAVIVLDNTKDKVKVIFNDITADDITVKANIDLTDYNKLLGNIFVELKNGSNPYFRIKNDSAFVKSTISGLNKRAIKSFKIEKLHDDLCNYALSVEEENPTHTQEKYHTYELPMVTNGVDSWHMNLLTKERTSPLELPRIINEKYEYNIVIPKDSRLVYQPVMSVLNFDFGYLKVIIEQKDNEISVIREIGFNKKFISITEYANFKKLMDMWNNKNYRQVIFSTD